MLYGLGLWLAFSWTGLFWGFFLSTVLLWHGTFAINSVMHVFGKRVFETRDTSRNSFLMALVTMGEGWHNNHHHFQASAAQGFLWWQVDPSLYLLRLGRLLGIANDLRPVPEKVTALARERAVWHFSSPDVREGPGGVRRGAGRPGTPAPSSSRPGGPSGARPPSPRPPSGSPTSRPSRQRAAAQLERLKADYAAALAVGCRGDAPAAASGRRRSPRSASRSCAPRSSGLAGASSRRSSGSSRRRGWATGSPRPPEPRDSGSTASGARS